MYDTWTRRAALLGAALTVTMASPALAAVATPPQALSSCAACHDLTSARKAKFGPALYGVFGTKPASKALHYAKWDAKSLDSYLADPKKADPGSRMPIRVADAKKRAEVVAALKKLK